MTGRVYISSQNHGYAVDINTVKPEIAVPAFVNVNDGTNEGLKYTGKNISLYSITRRHALDHRTPDTYLTVSLK